MPCQHSHACARSHSTPAGVLKGDTVAKATASTFLCTQPHHCISACAETCHAMIMLLACRPRVETLAEHHAHLPARQSDVARIAEQGTQGASRPILSTKPLTSIMHALSACAGLCEVTEPHLLEVLQGGTVAKATALTFLCTTDTPLHECWSRHMSCKDDAAAWRPKVDILAKNHQQGNQMSHTVQSRALRALAGPSSAPSR